MLLGRNNRGFFGLLVSGFGLCSSTYIFFVFSFVQPVYDIQSQMSKQLRLKSSDGVITVVDDSVAIQFEILKPGIENDNTDIVIPLPNVNIDILRKVICYCKRHVDAVEPEDKDVVAQLRDFDADFIRVDRRTVSKLMLAAYYLGIESLKDLTNQNISNKILVGLSHITTEELGRAYKLHAQWLQDRKNDKGRDIEVPHLSIA